jgi:hypothetical protein
MPSREKVKTDISRGVRVYREVNNLARHISRLKEQVRWYGAYKANDAIVVLDAKNILLDTIEALEAIYFAIDTLNEDS